MGHTFATAAEMDRMMKDTFGSALEAKGFEQVDRRRWVRSSRLPIRDVFSIQAMKGTSFAPCWGVSVDFVPHVSGSTVRWHRSAKASQFDLRYDPLDYVTAKEGDGWMFSSCAGVEQARRECESVCKKSVGLAVPWYAAIEHVPDLIREFEAKKARPFVRFGFSDYGQEMLAYAFSLAAAHRVGDAQREFAQYLDAAGLHDDLREKLRTFLVGVIPVQ